MVRQFEIVGRKLPTAEQPNTSIYRMTIFADNAVVAKSRFNYFMSRIKKMKRSHCEILQIREIFEKKPTAVKNFGVNIRYDSRSGTHNMYKEYRDVTLCGAIEQMYNEMAARHRARRTTIQIISTKRLEAKECVRPLTKQFIDSKIRFPLVHRAPRVPTKEFRSPFKANRPSTLF